MKQPINIFFAYTPPQHLPCNTSGINIRYSKQWVICLFTMYLCLLNIHIQLFHWLFSLLFPLVWVEDFLPRLPSLLRSKNYCLLYCSNLSKNYSRSFSTSNWRTAGSIVLYLGFNPACLRRYRPFVIYEKAIEINCTCVRFLINHAILLPGWSATSALHSICV